MEGKSVLITGAGAGIGRAAAFAFAREGTAVVVVDKQYASAIETVASIVAGGGRAHPITCDVGDGDAVDLMFAEAVEVYGAVDFAFNNAGVSQAYADTADIDRSEWNRIFRVNVEGAWHCMRNELKHMAAKGAGAIVNTASLAGLRSIKNQSAYVSSKHALVGLTKNAAVEYAARGVRVNAICPGGIVTGMLTDALAVSGTNEPEVTQAMKDAAALHPMNRLGQASEIADAAVFLCSDKAAFITGTMLSVDGGWAAI